MLLAVIAGAAIGLKIGLPGSGGTVSAAPLSAEEEAASGLAFAPATGRRPVKAVGLYTGREAPAVGLQPVSGVDGESVAQSTSSGSAADAPVSYDAPYGRDLTFMAFPSGATVPSTTTTEGTSTSTTSAPAPSGPPPTISGVRTLALGPFSATLSWNTSEQATSRIAYGLDTPVIWTAPTAAGTTHQVTVTGLTFSSTYHLDVVATTPDGRSSVSQFLLTTPAMTGPVRVTTGNAAVLLNGQSWFPKIVWNQCPDAVARFGSIGTYLPDEWDTHLPNDYSLSDALKAFPLSTGSGPRFLTLTNHFYSRAAPLPQGRGMYPALVASADVLGFDLYPLQNWCRFDSFHDVFDSQLDLVAIARGKPTFQWIEARRMDCTGDQLDPTPETVRAEAWLSIAGGAHGIGYFPNNWTAAVGAEIAQTNHEISSLTPALVEGPIAASASLGSTVKVGARDHNGAVYVIAVNASRAPATATITVPALVDRTLVTLDGMHKVSAKDGAFTADFAPLEARIYIAAPSS